MTNKTERIEIRLTPEGVKSMDEWRWRQTDRPSRAEAVRRLVEAGLGIPDANHDFPLIYLTVQLLCELHSKLGINPDKEDALDAEFVGRMVREGHLWALNWRYHFPAPFQWQEAPPVVQEVCDILEMFDLMELGYEALPEDGRDELEGFQRFEGFDGNNESEQRHIAGILVEDLERWQRFKGRAVRNTHFPVLGGYRRMLRAFDPMKTIAQRRPGCTAAEISALLQARIHPDNRR